MRLYKFLNENKNNYKSEAINFVKDFIISSKFKAKLSEESKKWLQQTISTPLVLYRGIGLIRQRLDKNQIDIVNNLKEGDELPIFLNRKQSKFSSYTKKKSVAKYYSEGKVSIIVSNKIDKRNLICDLEKLKDITDEFKENESYFKEDKEVIVEEPVDMKIIFKKGIF